ncbi:hypothetical protein Thpro_023012 [Acidihalobacter prosperus]|uniref:YgjP-like metallopeptidase domain-containing protein n=1 Tax=Acidihalobacter prosperus TaxID=160660 RepID=A0A1A6C2G7_9GAMM|nr:hypothetical protein Thpro_023012 [Acidihalobacter prosperus]
MVVTVPHGISQAHALHFVESQRQWIERQLARLPLPARPGPPERLLLPAAGLDLQVHAEPVDRNARTPPRLLETTDGLRLRGDWRTQDAWHDLLSAWLRKRARTVLHPLLSAQAKSMGLRHGRLSVRLQRSRWGSCNRHGDISLNAKLLLLSPALMRHVVIHELAHIRHLDHSPAFWAVVAEADPAWREHRRALYRAAAMLPGWLERAPTHPPSGVKA